MLSLCSPAAAHLCACCCARSSCCFHNVYISACLQHAGGLAWCHAQAERVDSYAPQCDAVRVLGMCPAVGVVPPCFATSYQHAPCMYICVWGGGCVVIGVRRGCLYTRKGEIFTPDVNCGGVLACGECGLWQADNRQ